MVNEVLQTVIDYVKLPHTDYAVLINGPWGCGKTYFWKNMVGLELERLLDSKHIERVLYVSLYGMSDVKDIDRSLFAQSYPGINKKWVGKMSRFVSGAIEALGYVDLAKVDLGSLVKVNNSVVCFDDLERSNLPFKEVLGYINTFVEHEGAKVVILCNEKALDEEDVPLYRKMKEKVVGNSLDYKPDYKSVLSTLTDEYKDQKEFHDFLIKNTDLIFHLFKNSETDNLRSLRRAITTLNMVFKTLYEGGIDPSQLAKQLIYAVGPTAFELYGRAADPEKLKAIHAMDYMSLAGIAMMGLKRDEAAEKTYEEQFNDRYFNELGFMEMGSAIGCPPVCEYMITGYLDKDLLLEWAKKLTQIPDEKDQRIKHLIYNAKEMDDKEFEETASQVLDYIQSGDITEIKTYASLYGHFEWYIDEGLVIVTKDQLFEAFKAGFLKAQKAGKLQPNQHLPYEISRLMSQPMSKESQTFRDFVIEMNKQIFDRQRSEHINELLSRFQDEPLAFINALTDHGESGFLLTPVFNQLDIEETANKILSMPNGLRMQFGLALNARYLKYQPQSEYFEELPGLIGIRDAIKTYCEEPAKGLAIPMSLFITQNIVETLDQTIDRLQALKQREVEPAHE